MNYFFMILGGRKTKVTSSEEQYSELKCWPTAQKQTNILSAAGPSVHELIIYIRESVLFHLNI